MVNKMYKKYEEIIKYLFFGGLTFVVSIVSYGLFSKFFHIQYLISNILSWILAVTFAFITNKLFVFKSNSKEKKQVTNEVIQFFVFRLISLGIEMGILFIFVDIIKFNDLIVKIMAQIIVILLNYIFSKLFIFNTKK